MSSHSAAKPKKPLPDAAQQGGTVPMTVGIKPAQRRSPDSEQKKVRRNMNKKTATMGEAELLRAMATATTIEARAEFAAALGEVRANQRRVAEQARTLDWSGMDVTAGEVPEAFKKNWNKDDDSKDKSDDDDSKDDDDSGKPWLNEDGTKKDSSRTAEADDDAIDVWLRILGDDEEAEAEANTYKDGSGYRVDWYLNSVGLVKSVNFSTLADAYAWLEREGFANYSSGDYTGSVQAAAPSMRPNVARAHAHGHTAESNWIADVAASPLDTAEVERTARAEAAVWIRSRPIEVLTDGPEFGAQVTGAAVRFAGRFGDQATPGYQAFVAYAAHLRSRKVTAEGWPTVTPPGFEVKDTPNQGEASNLPVAPDNDDTFDEALFTPAGQPQSETSPSDAPSLAEGDEPESDTEQGVANPTLSDPPRVTTPPSLARRRTASIVGYTADADIHCPNCTHRIYGDDHLGSTPVHDGEGNEVHPVFGTDEYEGEHCGTCGVEIGSYSIQGSKQAFDLDGFDPHTVPTGYDCGKCGKAPSYTKLSPADKDHPCSGCGSTDANWKLKSGSRKTAAPPSRQSPSRGRAPARNDFSLSDAKNEDGEWVMSPEQIRSEMSANDPEDPDNFYDDDGYYSKRKTARQVTGAWGPGDRVERRADGAKGVVRHTDEGMASGSGRFLVLWDDPSSDPSASGQSWEDADTCKHDGSPGGSTASRKTSLVDAIMAYEAGSLDRTATIRLFQSLVSTGTLRTLGPDYAKTAQVLIDGGLVKSAWGLHQKTPDPPEGVVPDQMPQQSVTDDEERKYVKERRRDEQVNPPTTVALFRAAVKGRPFVAEVHTADTCSVCGDTIERDPKGEDNRSYHHDNSGKHDHEAKPGSDKESSRHTADKDGKDAWGRPLMQPGDGHGAWDCNNYDCSEHPQSLYPQEGEGKVQSTPGWLLHDTKSSARRTAARHTAATCSVCGDAIEKDPSGEANVGWHHDNGTKHDHEAKPGSDKESSHKTAASTCSKCGQTVIGMTTFNVNMRDRNQTEKNYYIGEDGSEDCPKGGEHTVEAKTSALSAFKAHTSARHTASGDVIETKVLPSRDGFDLVAEKVPDLDSNPEDTDAYSPEDVAAWREDSWAYVGIIVKASKHGVELGSDSIWGTEDGTSPSWPHAIDGFDTDYLPDLIDGAIAEAKAAVAKLTASSALSAFKASVKMAGQGQEWWGGLTQAQKTDICQKMGLRTEHFLSKGWGEFYSYEQMLLLEGGKQPSEWADGELAPWAGKDASIRSASRTAGDNPFAKKDNDVDETKDKAPPDTEETPEAVNCIHCNQPISQTGQNGEWVHTATGQAPCAAAPATTPPAPAAPVPAQQAPPAPPVKASALAVGTTVNLFGDPYADPQGGPEFRGRLAQFVGAEHEAPGVLVAHFAADQRDYDNGDTIPCPNGHQAHYLYGEKQWYCATCGWTGAKKKSGSHQRIAVAVPPEHLFSVTT